MLLIGAGLIGLTNGAGAAVSKGPDPAGAPAPAAVQPLAATINATPVGTWTLTTDFGCDGSITGSFTQTFNADGSWSSSPFVHSGRWYQVGGMVVWTFADTANLVYSGNLSGGWFAGVQGFETAGGSTGCFGGHLSSITSGAGANGATGKADPVTGR